MENACTGKWFTRVTRVASIFLALLETLTHRWLYARSDAGGEPQLGHLWFASEQLGLAGDWLAGGRIEGAYNSAVGLVDAIGGSEQA